SGRVVASGRPDRAEGTERPAIRVAQGDHGGQEEADRRKETRGARSSRGGSGPGEDPVAEARAARAAREVPHDPGRRPRRRREGAGSTAAGRGEGAVKFLVFIEQRDGKIRKASLEALALARRLSGGPVAAVLPGKGVTPLAAALGKSGAGVVYVADREDLALYTNKGYVGALAAAA